MADQPITGLPTKVASGVAATDKMLGIDSAEGYQILVRDVAKYILENCNVSTLAGSVQTPKAAIDLLNSNSHLLTAAPHKLTSGTDLNNINTAGVYDCDSSTIASSLLHCPVTTGFRLIVEQSGYASLSYGYQTIMLGSGGSASSVGGLIYRRVLPGTISSAVWGDWIQLPTRAEIDLLNSRTTSRTTTATPNTNYISTIYNNLIIRQDKAVFFSSLCRVATEIPASGVIFTLPYNTVYRADFSITDKAGNAIRDGYVNAGGNQITSNGGTIPVGDIKIQGWYLTNQ